MINYTHIYIDIYELYLNCCNLLPAKPNWDVSISRVIVFVLLISAEEGLPDEFYRRTLQNLQVAIADSRS